MLTARNQHGVAQVLVDVGGTVAATPKPIAQGFGAVTALACATVERCTAVGQYVSGSRFEAAASSTSNAGSSWSNVTTFPSGLLHVRRQLPVGVEVLCAARRGTGGSRLEGSVNGGRTWHALRSMPGLGFAIGCPTPTSCIVATMPGCSRPQATT